jgi:hypothetical protein
MEKAFGRDASSKKTSSSKFGVLFNQGGFQAQMRSTNRGYVTTRSSTNNNKIIVLHDGMLLPRATV